MQKKSSSITVTVAQCLFLSLQIHSQTALGFSQEVGNETYCVEIGQSMSFVKLCQHIKRATGKRAAKQLL